mmetsp:Transcript_12170/g.37466  ORF Transcript_12170/g.37466 Transcript_12170/m.37466 type:complete len:412 (-) Transcript_12170:63-1298(-)
MAAASWTPSLGADADKPVRKAGALLKLPKRTLATSASWQARDFVLDSDAGALSYFDAGGGGVPDRCRSAVDLRGASARPLEGKHKGKPHCFVVEAGEQTLTLAAPTADDRDDWVKAVRTAAKKLAIAKHWRGAPAAAAESWPEARRFAPGSKSDGAAESDVAAVQDETLSAVGRMRRQLTGTQEIANATSDTLRAQDEQLHGITRDLDRANSSLKEADKRLDSLESWRIFGGKSKKKGRKAEKLTRRAAERDGAAAASPEAGKKLSSRGSTLDSIDEAPGSGRRLLRRSSSTAGKDLGDRRLSSSSMEGGRRLSRRGSSNVTMGLEGRDDEEKAALQRIAARDEEVNRGLDDLDGLLDALGNQAKAMNTHVRRQSKKLDDVRDELHDAEVGTARVNARARHNVGYYGRPDL